MIIVAATRTVAAAAGDGRTEARGEVGGHDRLAGMELRDRVIGQIPGADGEAGHGTAERHDAGEGGYCRRRRQDPADIGDLRHIVIDGGRG